MGPLYPGVARAESVPEPIAFHLELRVRALEASIAFYRCLLTSEPTAVVAGKYALFDTDNLQLLLRVSAVQAEPVHFGFRLSDEPALAALEVQWCGAGLPFTRHQFDHRSLAMTEIADNLDDPDGHRCSFYVLRPSPAETDPRF